MHSEAVAIDTVDGSLHLDEHGGLPLFFPHLLNIVSCRFSPFSLLVNNRGTDGSLGWHVGATAGGRPRNRSDDLSILVDELAVVAEDHVWKRFHLDRQLHSRDPCLVEV